jgi:hypothetical protein
MSLMVGGDYGIVVEVAVDKPLDDGKHRDESATARNRVVNEQNFSFHR